MSIATADNVEAYVAEFQQQLEHNREPRWLTAQRVRAIELFAETGFPTNRDEEWRKINFAPLNRQVFRSVDAVTEPTWEEISGHVVDLAGPRVVFVDGQFSSTLSNLADAGAVEILTLRQALETHADLLSAHLGSYASLDEQPFTAMNTALWSDGVLLRIPKGVVVEQPIQLIYLSTAQSGTMSHPRTLVLAERDCHASVIEYHLALGDAEYFSNGVTEVVVQENAFLAHYWIEMESDRAINVSTLRAEMAKASRFESHTVLLGGAIVRNNVHPVLNGEGCDCLINGVYVGNNRQHLDNHMRVEHAKAHGDSRQFYRGILDGHSTGVFTGRIVVHPDAQKTDAKQNNSNLLLSDDAEADSKPQLEIYADDVKCTHGATIGQMDDESIFYLRSRGIDLTAARNMLIHAFASESLDRMQLPQVRQFLEQQINKRLP